MEDKKHNGWTNIETWNVSSWLGNDSATYDLMSKMKMTEAAQFKNFCIYLWGKFSPDGHSLKNVNWQEIADEWSIEK